MSLYAKGEIYLESEHFKIIYNEESKNMAFQIMSIAEEEYDRLVDFFKQDPDLHIPIYINNEEKSYNAYLAVVPSLHLVFYNTHISQRLYYRDDTIRLVFRHELTHAIMYYYKGFLGKITTSIFGDGADIAKSLHYLKFITEGMAVYLESFDGKGRLNNPYINQLRIQAAIENKKINYLDASGSMDIFPNGYLSYYLGGAFFEWVAQRYGKENLAAFILDCARNVFSFPQNAYKKHFNSRLYDDWNTFCDETEVPSNIIETEYILNKENYSDLTSDNNSIYALSKSTSELIKIEDTKITPLFNFTSQSSTIDIKDDKFLLSYTSSMLCYTALYDNKGNEIKRYNDYYEGAFYNNNTIALLKYYDTNTTLEIIGEKSIALGTLVSATNLFTIGDKLGFLFEDDKGQAIAIYDKELNLYRINDEIKIYSIKSNGKALSISYCKKKSGEVLKYGEFNLDNNTLYLSDVNINGGVNNPVRLNNYIYFHCDLFNYSNLSRIEVEELNLTYYSTLKSEIFSPKIADNKLKNTHKYNPLSSLLRGYFIPFAANNSKISKALTSVGLTWITTDPSERLLITASGGYSLKEKELFLAFSLSYDDLKLSFSKSTIQSETELLYSKTFYLKNQNQKIILSDSILYNNPQNRFTNILEFTYSDLMRKSIKRNNISGSKITLKLVNKYPIITAQTYTPGIFPLIHAISFDSLNKKIRMSLQAQLFNIEVQNSLYPLPLYITNIIMYANTYFNFSARGLDTTYKLSLKFTLSPTIGILSETYSEFGFELTYKNSFSFSILFNYNI